MTILKTLTFKMIWSIIFLGVAQADCSTSFPLSTWDSSIPLPHTNSCMRCTVNSTTVTCDFNYEGPGQCCEMSYNSGEGCYPNNPFWGEYVNGQNCDLPKSSYMKKY